MSDFICERKIDEEKVKKYDQVLSVLEGRKECWAMNTALPPIDSIKIYGAYSTVYGTLYGIAKNLDLGIKRKENPKAAKEVYSILQNAVDLIPKLEKVTKEKKAPAQIISEIFDASRSLRRQAINKQIIQAGELPDRKKLIIELGEHIESNLN
ncbi:hypothetical protein AUJ17_01300 [Candidatus Micrarchaeota archaeon CG1_02_47_40]|nr:MAG: hypothetical protein AUJ17_01300 [Candidatus Micrarchaeota archaeon CG1_02_47_40]